MNKPPLHKTQITAIAVFLLLAVLSIGAMVYRRAGTKDAMTAIVSVDGESATVKRFFRTDHTVTLMPQSLNPVHQMQVYDLRNTDIRIIGKVVKVEFTL